MLRGSRKSQSGNVLFLILIASALFAALSYVIAQSARTGSGDAGREQARLEASSILNHATAVQTAVGRLLLRGCDLEQISFENGYDSLHVNPKAPPDHKCDVFHPAGGGISERAANPDWASDIIFRYTSSEAVTGVGQTCASAECVDLAMVLFDIKETLCEQINAQNGILKKPADLPTETQQACPYEGTLDCGGNGNVEVIFSDPELRGRNSICYKDSVHGYTFQHVILER